MKKIFVLIGLLLFVSLAYAQEDETDWMPDANLRMVIREHIKLPDEIPLAPHLVKITRLRAANRNITNLKGLEQVTTLEYLDLNGNKVSDLTPLAGLTKLEELLIGGNEITDLTPLAGLTLLEKLVAALNQISDITPLAELTQLKGLFLGSNQIVDISILSGLIQLENLVLSSNKIVDVSPLLELTQLKRLKLEKNPIQNFESIEHLIDVIPDIDIAVCRLPALSVTERIENKKTPSIYAWGGRVFNSYAVNRTDLTNLEKLTLHEKSVCCWFFDIFPDPKVFPKVLRGNLEKATQLRDQHLELNPNMIFLVGIEMRAVPKDLFPEDSPYWQRDPDGNVIWAPKDTKFINFTHPDVQQMIIDAAIAVAECGLYDGIIFDWWRDFHHVLPGWGDDWEKGRDLELAARANILKGIRESVREDFLIGGNVNRLKIPNSAWAINSGRMECGKDYPGGFTHAGLSEIGDTLLWLENNLRAPLANSVDFNAVESEPMQGDLNKKWMRVGTTLTLTHSDGYFLFSRSLDGKAHWYTFWDANLGRPVGSKGQQYDENIKGLFIREFTNGWAVFNRSYKERKIRLPEYSMGVESGIRSTVHAIPDLDGEIYLKAPPDLNNDGVVNILDLVIIANAFGEDEPDLNGDGVVNIQDLVIIAQSFGE